MYDGDTITLGFVKAMNGKPLLKHQWAFMSP
jgi:hypothetical protein